MIDRATAREWFRLRHERVKSSTRESVADIERQLLESCHPKQRAYVEDPSRRFAALTGGRCGKTTGALVRLLRKAIKVRGARLLFVAKTRDQAQELIWSRLLDLCSKLGVRVTPNITLLRIRVELTGATIKLVGADDRASIEKLRGLPWHEVIIDEAASYSERLLDELVHRVLGPRMGDFRGCLGLQGTPGHFLQGLFYDVTRNGSEIAVPWDQRDRASDEELGGWSVHRWSLLDGIAAGVKAMINAWEEGQEEKKTNKWSDDHPVWRREWLGEWAADNTTRISTYRPHAEDGASFNQWDPPRNRHGFAVLPKERTDWRYGIGIDLGHGTPFALQVLAFSPSDNGRNIYHVFEFHQKGMYPRTIAELLIGKDLSHDRMGGVFGAIGGWPDANAVDCASLGEAILKELSEVYGITLTPVEKERHYKHGAIELANGDLCDQRIWVLKGSQLESEMLSLQWRVDEFGLLKDPKHGDNAHDAFIYGRRAIASLFGEEQKESRTPAAAPIRDEQSEWRPAPEEGRIGGEYGGLLDDGGWGGDGWGGDSAWD